MLPNLIQILMVFTLCSCSFGDHLYWTMINVNNTPVQGDSHFIHMDNLNILIDAGMAPTSGPIIENFLKEKNIDQIDYFYLSHYHFDHYGGLIHLLNSDIKFKNFVHLPPTEEQCSAEPWGCDYSKLLQIWDLLKQKKVKIILAKKGYKISTSSDHDLEILYAFDGRQTPVGKTDMNDMSLIMMLRDHNLKYLLAGDLNQRLGQFLTQNADNIKADILKAPHHGASNWAPNSFVEKVNPTVFMVPSPHQLWCSSRDERARKLAQKMKLRTYVNGIHGHTTVSSYGTKYIINTQNPYISPETTLCIN